MDKTSKINKIKYLKYLQIINNAIWNLNEENIDKSVEMTKKLFDTNFPYSVMLISSQLIYSSFISQRKDLNIYFQFLKTFSTNDSDNIIDVFVKYLIHLKSQESYYILEKMHQRNLIDSDILRKVKSFYFAHYKTYDEIISLENFVSSAQYFKSFMENIEELKKDDWKLHKQLIEEGCNQDEIMKIIRNDEIEKLQELTAQTNFDFNQKIKPSLYERYSFINKEDVTLIDYAAFFGSINCFKFLLLNGSDIYNSGKYAVANGNLEMIHLCHQNNSSFNGSYEAAIEFHQNEIFKYLYENKISKFENFNELRKKCIQYNNYKILSFFIKGIRNLNLIYKAAAENGNVFIYNYFYEENFLFPEDILLFCVKSGNIEFFKFLLLNKDANINAKDDYLSFSHMFHFSLWN